MRISEWLVAGVVFGVVGCGESQTARVSGDPGAPLSTLTEPELGRFLFGKAVFDRLTTPEEGLGPLFNEDRCFSCHDQPASGGSGPALVLKATRFVDGQCSLLEHEGGDNIQQKTTLSLQALDIYREDVPASATDTVRVTAPSLFGLGLVEAIPDETIQSHADPTDENDDGISGRAGTAGNGALGRFGRKSEIQTIREFVDTALRFELGLTTVLHPQEESLNGTPLPPEVDPMRDPEIDDRGLDALTDYIQFLAAPARALPESPAGLDSVAAGELVFEEIGCAACHIPVLQTGPHPSSALDRQPVPMYSDLLLHDMGPELADVCGENAGPSEYRTARLWGLRFRTALLHDGRAATPEQAIQSHGGEAADARSRFQQLSAVDRANLLRFLITL